MVIISAPASENGLIQLSAGLVIKCTSNNFLVYFLRFDTTSGPIVRLGTK